MAMAITTTIITIITITLQKITPTAGHYHLILRLLKNWRDADKMWKVFETMMEANLVVSVVD